MRCERSLSIPDPRRRRESAVSAPTPDAAPAAASSDYQQPGIGILDILRRAEERGLDIIALTDHNSVRGYADLWREIEDLALLEYLGRLQPNEAERLAEFRRLLAQILVLPGFESCAPTRSSTTTVPWSSALTSIPRTASPCRACASAARPRSPTRRIPISTPS